MIGWFERPLNFTQTRRLQRRRLHHLLLRGAQHLMRRSPCDRAHVLHVTRLALRLFDELRPLHRLTARERLWLHCAALLHDIGKGQPAHHKVALRIVLRTPVLPVDKTTRRIIGCIARYHTKALPSLNHRNFAALRPGQRRVVLYLSALLRLADALDRRHGRHVRHLRCAVSSRRIIGFCARRSPNPPPHQRMLEARALQKGRLLKQVFDRKLQLEWL